MSHKNVTKKDYMVALIDAEKVSDKVQHAFMISSKEF